MPARTGQRTRRIAKPAVHRQASASGDPGCCLPGIQWQRRFPPRGIVTWSRRAPVTGFSTAAPPCGKPVTETPVKASLSLCGPPERPVTQVDRPPRKVFRRVFSHITRGKRIFCPRRPRRVHGIPLTAQFISTRPRPAQAIRDTPKRPGTAAKGKALWHGPSRHTDPDWAFPALASGDGALGLTGHRRRGPA